MFHFIPAHSDLNAMSNEFWVLYDPQQKAQSDKMSTEDAQFSLMKMKTKELDNFLIWRNDWDKWKKLKEFLNSDDSPFMSTFIGGKSSGPQDDSAPSTIKMKPVDSETEKKIQASFSNVQLGEVKLAQAVTSPQFDAEQLEQSSSATSPSSIDFKSIGKTNAFGKTNKDDRYKIELLLVHTKGNMFRSTARDISLSGTFSERIVPDEYHHAPFDLIIINNIVSDNRFKRMTLKARVVITDSSIYLEYVSPTDEQKQNLHGMLEQYVHALKQL